MSLSINESTQQMKTIFVWIFCYFCILIFSSKSESIFECLHFENESPWFVLSQKSQLSSLDEKPVHMKEELVSEDSKISLDVNCNLISGECMSLGNGSRLYLDGVELTKYYHSRKSFSQIYMSRDKKNFDIFSLHVATPSIDMKHFLRVDIQIWFAEDPLDFGIFISIFCYDKVHLISRDFVLFISSLLMYRTIRPRKISH
jgi:hypothetical protein